jgi:hypothetical protein
MGRQELLDYLQFKTNQYDKLHVGKRYGLSMTRGGEDMQFMFSPICERPIFSTGYDVFGVHWTRAIPASHKTPGQKPIVSDIGKWREEVRIPIVDRFDWDYVREQAKRVDRENKLIVTTLAIGIFERSTTFSDYEDCLVSILTEPEEYSDMLSVLADYKIEVIKRMYETGHPDVINLHDDWGTATSTWLNPELWREVIKPHTARIYAAVNDLGMMVSQHSCGKVTPFIEDMIEMGATIWEGQGDINDMDAINDMYGSRIRLNTSNLSEQERIEDEKKEMPGPDVTKLPMCYRHYDEVPEFLYI